LDCAPWVLELEVLGFEDLGLEILGLALWAYQSGFTVLRPIV
jgi:hypothetical protein